MKKTIRLFRTLALWGCVFTLLAGCPLGNDDSSAATEEEEELIDDGVREEDDSGAVTLADQKFTHTAGIQYYSLSQGVRLKLADKGTQKWDIALGRYSSPSYLFIYVNGGVTAAELKTGGQGKVWFTGKTDFAAVTLNDRVTDFTGDYAEYEPYTQDVYRWMPGMSGYSRQRLNVMTYCGYPTGDGSEENPFTRYDEMIFFDYNKQAAYRGIGGMPPDYEPTMQVYIIQSPDQSAYYKFQLTGIAVSGQSYALDFKFSKLE